jgi:hypothetical protein
LSLTSTTTLGVTGVSTLTGGATVNGPLIIGWNSSANYPTSGGYGVLGWNFSGGSAEVNSWNAYVGAVVSFNWKQKTGTSTATDLMQLSPTGFLTTTGGAVIQGLTVGLGANAVANNTAVGVGALGAATLSGGNNTGAGAYALNANTSGNYNNAFGFGALAQNTTGVSNAAVGYLALYANISGGFNTSIGNNSLVASTGSTNIGIGSGAGSSLTTGNNNTIIGSVAGTAGLSDTVIIAAGSAERMRIDSSGVISYTGSLTVSAYTETIVASGTVGASATLAITAGTVLTATLTSATACTITLPPVSPAGKSFILLLKQPASGTATTATFITSPASHIMWNSSGAPTITATVGKMDILTFVSDGTNWYGSYSQGYTP